MNSIIKTLDRLDEKKKSRLERVEEYTDAIEKFLDEDPIKIAKNDFGSHAHARYTFSDDRVIYLTVENIKSNTSISFGGSLLCSWVYPVGDLNLLQTAQSFNGVLKTITQAKNKTDSIIRRIEEQGVEFAIDDHWDDVHTKGHFNTSVRLITMPPKGFEPRFTRIVIKNTTSKYVVLVNGNVLYSGDDVDQIVETFVKHSPKKVTEAELSEADSLGNLSVLDPWIIERLKYTPWVKNQNATKNLPLVIGKDSPVEETRLTSGPRKIWDSLAGEPGEPKVEFYVLVYDGIQIAFFGRTLLSPNSNEWFPNARIVLKHTAFSKVKNLVKFTDDTEISALLGRSSFGSKEVGFRDFSEFLKRIASKAKETQTNFAFLEIKTDSNRVKAQKDRFDSKDGLIPLPHEKASYNLFLKNMKNDLLNRLKSFKANAYSCKTVDELVELMTHKTFGLTNIIFDSYPYVMNRLNQYEFGSLLFQLYGDYRPNETADQREKRLNLTRNENKSAHVEWTIERTLSPEEKHLLTLANKKLPPYKITVIYKIKNNQIVPSVIEFKGDTVLDDQGSEKFIFNESILNEIGIVADPKHENCSIAVANFVRSGKADAMAKELIAWKAENTLRNSYMTRVKLLASIKKMPTKLPFTKKSIDDLSEEIYVVADMGHTEEIDKTPWAKWVNYAWNMLKTADDRALVAQMMLQAAGKTRAFFSTFNSVASAIFLSNDVNEFKRHLVGDTCEMPVIEGGLDNDDNQPPPSTPVNEATENAIRKLNSVAAFLSNLYDIEMIEQGPKPLSKGFEPWYRGITKQGLKLNLESQGGRIKYKFDVSESKEEYMQGNDVRAFANLIARKAAHYDQCAILRDKFSDAMSSIGLKVELFGPSRAYTMGSDFARAHLRVTAGIVTIVPSGKPGIKIECGAYVKFMLGNPNNISRVAAAIDEDFKAGDSNWPATKKILDEILVKPRPLSR